MKVFLFLSDLAKWFFSGELAAVPAEQQVEQAVEEAVVAAEKAEAPVKTPENIYSSIISESKAQSLLDDLNAIEPYNRQFDKAREDLIQEIKRLVPSRRIKKGK